MKRKISPLAVAAALALSGLGAQTALAQNFAWTGAVNNTWDTTTANWSGFASVWFNLASSQAAFAGTSAGLTLGADITANSLSFSSSGWTLANGATPRTLTLAGTNPAVNVQTGTVAISVPITSTSMFKTGAGTLQLKNNVSGIMSVNGGVLDISGSASISTGGMHVGLEGLSGTVNVTGAGSVLKPGTFITVGDSLGGAGPGGNGTLTIGNGGVVTVNPTAKLTVGWINATGTVNLNTDGVLEVGGTNGIQKHATGTTNFILNGGTLRVIGSDLTTSVPMSMGMLQQTTIDTNGFNATLSGPITGLGALIKSGTGVLTLGGSNSIVQGVLINQGVVSLSQDANIGHIGGVGFNGGTLRTTASILMDRSFNLFSSGTINVQAGDLTNLSGLAATNEGLSPLEVNGAGTLSIKYIRTNGTLTINNPRVNVLEGRSTNNTSVVGVIALAPGSSLNLNDQDMVVNYQPGQSSLASVASMIATGYANGVWNGPGIMSEIATFDGTTALGYAEASDVFGSFPATFSGRTVDSSSVLVRYTYYGDANLDGLVNVRDLMNLASHWQQSGQFWFAGDFDYDGIVGPKDLGLLAMNWQIGASPGQSFEDALQAFGLTNAVPEPAVGAIGALLLPFLSRQRRTRKSD